MDRIGFEADRPRMGRVGFVDPHSRWFAPSTNGPGPESQRERLALRSLTSDRARMERIRLGPIKTSTAARAKAAIPPWGPQVLRSVRRILEENTLCSVAAVAPGHRAHLPAAYYSYPENLDLYLSHPGSVRGRNLAASSWPSPSSAPATGRPRPG
jgi:hypothetical protein